MGARAHMSARLRQIMPRHLRLRLRRPAGAGEPGRGLPGRPRGGAEPDRPDGARHRPRGLAVPGQDAGRAVARTAPVWVQREIRLAAAARGASTWSPTQVLGEPARARGRSGRDAPPPDPPHVGVADPRARTRARPSGGTSRRGSTGRCRRRPRYWTAHPRGTGRHARPRQGGPARPDPEPPGQPGAARPWGPGRGSTCASTGTPAGERRAGGHAPRGVAAGVDRAAGIVLAGGRSSRMGAAKAALEWHGSTLVRRVAGSSAGPSTDRWWSSGRRGQVLPRLPAIRGRRGRAEGPRSARGAGRGPSGRWPAGRRWPSWPAADPPLLHPGSSRP